VITVSGDFIAHVGRLVACLGRGFPVALGVRDVLGIASSLRHRVSSSLPYWPHSHRNASR
jgi:hypothetical protein